MVVLSASKSSFIHKVLEKYINYTHCLCKPLFEFLLLGFLFGNNSSTLLFLLWKYCMIDEKLDVRLTVYIKKTLL